MGKRPARTAIRRAAGGRVQLLYKTDLSAGDYISTEAWRDAKLARCPNHPGGGCRFARHGSYGRKTPAGVRIARWYCPDSHMTFSLLPQFMAAGLPGALQPVEDCAAEAEAHGLAAAAGRMRPGHHGDPRAARRWIRRRAGYVRLFSRSSPGCFPISAPEPRPGSARSGCGSAAKAF